MRRPILFAAALLTVWMPSVHAEGWACTIDKAAGFGPDKKTNTWVEATFKPLSKYVIKPTEKLDADLHAFNPALPHEWAVFDNPKGAPLAYCGVNKKQTFVCHAPMPEYLDTPFGPMFSVVFDPKSLRFMAVYIAGYVSGEDTPMIQIGTCFPI